MTTRSGRRTGGTSIALALAITLALAACSSRMKPTANRSLHVVARISLGSNISQLAADGGMLWVAGSFDEGVRGIEMATGTIVADLGHAHTNIPGGGSALAVEGSIWVAYAVGTDPPSGFDGDPPPNFQEVYLRGMRTTADLYSEATAGGIALFEARSRRLQKTMLFLDWTPGSIALTPGAVWVVVDGLARIDPTSYEIVARLPVAGELVAGFQSVWVAGDDLVRIDPATNTITARIAIAPARDVAVGPDAVWVTTERALLRIDAGSNRVIATIPLEDPWGVAAAEDGVWVTGFRTGMLWLIDPKHNKVEANTELGGMLTDVVAVGESAWVAFEPGDSGRSAAIRVDFR